MEKTFEQDVFEMFQNIQTNTKYLTKIYFKKSAKKTVKIFMINVGIVDFLQTMFI